MQTNSRTGISRLSLSVVVSIAMLGLAGCQAPGDLAPDAAGPSLPATSGTEVASPASTDTDSALSMGPGQPAMLAMGFYLAQTQLDASLMPVQLNDTTIYVQREPVLTREDLSEAAALVDKTGKNFVGLRFTPAGARKLREITSQNVGKLLTLMLNGRMVAAPHIATPLNNGVLAFSVDTPKLAADIAAKVRGDAPAVKK